MVDTGYQPRRESFSICAPGVAVIGAHCLGEISFIIGADSCSGFAYGRIGPFWSGVFGTSSIIKGCFTYTLHSWASRRQARSSSSRNSEIGAGFLFEDVPPPSHHGIGSTGSHVFQEREAEVDPYEGVSVLHA